MHKNTQADAISQINSINEIDFKNEALSLISNNLCPVFLDSNKKPNLWKWKPLQNTILTKEEIEQLLNKKIIREVVKLKDDPIKSIGIICGTVSGNLEVIDVDCKYQKEGSDLWGDYSDLLKDNLEIYDSLVIAQTISGGYHIYYRCSKIDGNKKIARREPTKKEKEEKQEEIFTLIETRGEGGYVVAPPSVGYKYIQGNINNIPTITEKDREIIWAMAEQLNEVTDNKPAFKEMPTLSFSTTNKANKPNVFKNYRENGDIVDLLCQYGWKVVPKGDRERIYFLRPGTPTSETSGNWHIKERKLWIHSSNTGLTENTALSLVDVYMQLNNITDTKVVREHLINMGYGETIPPPPPPQEEEEAPPLTIPIEGLPKVAQSIIKHYSDTYSTPRDLWTGAFFSAIATAIGGGAELKTKYANNPVFWFITVAPSGTGKSEPATQFFAPFHKRDGDAQRKWKDAIKKWMDYKKLSKEEKETAIEVQAPPPALQYIVSDITPEKLIEANMNTPKGILMLRDEFRGYLKDIGRYNKSGEVEQLLSSFSQTPMTVNRKTVKSDFDNGTLKIEKPIINIFGGIQDALLHELKADGMDASGFLARFLFIYPPQFKKSKYNDAEVDELTRMEYVALIDKLMAYRTFNEPTTYTLSAEASKIYGTFYNRNAELIDACNESNQSTLATLYSKLDYYALRFALIFQCLKWAADGVKENVVSAETMQYSVDVCEYFRATGIKVMNELTPQESEAGKLDNKNVAIYLSAQGKSQGQIAKVLGISQQAVSKFLKQK